MTVDGFRTRRYDPYVGIVRVPVTKSVVGAVFVEYLNKMVVPNGYVVRAFAVTDVDVEDDVNT